LSSSIKRNVILSSTIGNALEFYDFTLCGVFVAILSKTFFPANNDISQLLAGFFAFSAAFWARPFGAALFGYIGDKYGRKVALTISVTMMGFPTLLIGILPGYETIGIWAPVILVILRLIQGLCAGGEYNGAAIFALEHFKTRPGLISGLIGGSCIFGIFGAAVAGYIVTNYTTAEWAWRVPFIIGAFISLVGYVIRTKTTETLDFIHTQKSVDKFPLARVIKDYPKQFFTAVFGGAFNGVMTYTLFGFLNAYLSRYYNLSIKDGLYYNMYGMLAFSITCVIFGIISDRIGAKRAMLIPGCLSIVAVLCLKLFQTLDPIYMIIGQLLFGSLVGSFVGVSHHFMQSLFPPQYRYSGISVGFCLGMAITGGSTAMLMLWFVESTRIMLAPAYYIACFGIIWFYLVRRMMHDGTVAESPARK
jgi:MHS family proline/betaine transporter-like MFS transporter